MIRSPLPRDLAVHLGPVGLSSFVLNALRGRADLALRLKCEALGFQVLAPTVWVRFPSYLLFALGLLASPFEVPLRLGSFSDQRTLA